MKVCFQSCLDPSQRYAIKATQVHRLCRSFHFLMKNISSVIPSSTPLFLTWYMIYDFSDEFLGRTFPFCVDNDRPRKNSKYYLCTMMFPSASGFILRLCAFAFYELKILRAMLSLLQRISA